MGLMDRLRAYLSPRPEQAAPAKALADMGEVSMANPSRLFPSSGVQDVYNPGFIARSQGGYSTIDNMRRDDQIKAAMSFKKGAVLAAGWEVVATEERPDDWEPLVSARKMLNQIDGTLNQVLREIMTALDYGHSISEKIFEERDGQIVVSAIKTRAPHEWTYGCDPHGNIHWLKQSGTMFPLPIVQRKFLLFAYDSEFSNPYGTSDLESAYRAWWTKKNAYQWMAMLLERMGIPPIVALYNPNSYTGSSTSVTQLRRFLERIQASTVGMIPRPNKEDIELWTPELAGQVASVFMPAMEMLNKDISRALLMPGLLGMTDDSQVGSLARAGVHFDAFMLVIDSLRDRLAGPVVQQGIINPFLALNYPPSVAPPDSIQFRFKPLHAEDKQAILTQWTGLVSGKIVRPQASDERHARELLNFPEANEKEQDEWAEANAPEPVPMMGGGDEGAFPSQDDDIEDEDEDELPDDEEEDDEDEPATRSNSSSSKRSLYVCRRVTNDQDLRMWAARVGLPFAYDDSGTLHLSLLYCEEPIDWRAMPQPIKEPEELWETGSAYYAARVQEDRTPTRELRILGEDRSLVLVLNDAWWLRDRNQKFRDAGAVDSFPTYLPHITLARGVAAVPADVEPYWGKLCFGPEIWEPITHRYMSDAAFNRLLRRIAA